MGDCTATWHSASSYAYRYRGCRCPETVAYVRKLWAGYRARERERCVRAPTYMEPVDEVAVQRAITGDRVRLTPRERAIAIDELTKRGLTADEIGRRVGRCARQVLRYRAGLIKRAQVAA